ncbi:hypothetical protein JCM3775_000495 [Rhodotorula graminis]
MIPTKADRQTDDGSEPVIVGSGGALSTGSGASANATETLPAGDNGGRAAHANQQQPEGQFPKQVKPEQAQPTGNVGGGGEGLKNHQA